MTVLSFPYSAKKHTRRQGPGGYALYQSYKEWLRDEFTFRCVYCLFREKWYPDGSQSFGVDHSMPQTLAPHLALSYENLLYACNRCNSFKSSLEVLDPCAEPFAAHVWVLPDGKVEASTAQGHILIDSLQLNEPIKVEWRRHVVLLANKLNGGSISPPAVADEIRWVFSFPEHLPDLRLFKPPINTKPQGVHETYFVQREQGKLPAAY